VNIQKVLQLIKDHPANKGKISIDFLKKMETEEAMEWLTSLPGVGLKTATLLLLFNYKKPVMPVDTHVFRVSQRIGILNATDTPEKAHLFYWNCCHLIRKNFTTTTFICSGTASGSAPGANPNAKNAW
jgi:endonuclease III